MTVSVVIPTYNRPSLLRAAIESALSQSTRPLEVLVCDDGHSSETAMVAAAFGSASVRYLPGPHTGAPALPRNRGIAAAAGEWIAFLDDDDAWRPDKLEIQLAAVDQFAARAASSRATLYYPDGVQGELLGIADPMVTLARLARGNALVTSSALVHRSVFDEVGVFPDARIAAEDYPMWLRVATVSPFANIADPCVRYLGRYPEGQPVHGVREKWALRVVCLQSLLTEETRPQWRRYFQGHLTMARFRHALSPLESAVRQFRVGSNQPV